ncbi:hypothetical protein AAFB76_002486 [Enterococcus faecalis]
MTSTEKQSNSQNYFYQGLQVVIFKTIVSIQKNAYPIYDEIKSLRRIEGVKAHLSYAVNKQD